VSDAEVSTPADTVFVDGAVLTPAGVVHAGAVAVAAGRIVATDPDQVRDLTGPKTEVTSLRDRLLIPGFVDAHVHPFFAGLELGECDVVACVTGDETLTTIAAYAAANPQREWITGSGWFKTSFAGGAPHRRDLDVVVPDRPAYLLDNSHHGAWVNSRALELAGIDRHSPDPPDGRIERDEDGEPTGILQEAATDLVGRFIPPPSQQEREAGLLRGQAHLHAFGVVGWQDAIVGAYLSSPDPFETYLRLADDGRLTARVVGALWWDRTRGLEQLDDLRDRRQRAAASPGRFRATSVKIMQDGVAETQTAAMLSPYFDCCGNAGTSTGHSFIDPAALRGYVAALDADGFQVHFHALGDRAVREALDALEHARRANGPTGRRHHLAHLQVVHPDDISRFADLHATGNVQALWACNDAAMVDLTIPVLGPERSGWQYPFGALARSGARLAAGSDWPVSSANPLDAIEVAVTRVEPGTDAAPFLPDQAISLSLAMHSYTAGSAWINAASYPETERALAGQILVGAPGDLVVLDRDPFAGAPKDIADARVLGTWVAGQRVYETDSL
jgi:predicted amidohydrolase YtcJ